MIDIGRLCVKIAGREAGAKCLVVDVIDQNMVMIDGQVKRKKCNIRHLELLKQKADIKKGASHADVVSALKKLKIEVKEKKKKVKKAEPAKEDKTQKPKK